MSYDKSVRGVRELHRVRLRDACGICYGNQACSEGIWNSAIPDGVRRYIDNARCTMGAKTQEECDLSLRD
jgi:hypothetical protein